MNTILSPIVSEFATQEDADSYDIWFKAKVTASMNSKEPLIPHDQVVAEIDQMLVEIRKKDNAN